MHRRELLAGLVGLTGAAVLGGPTAAAAPAGLRSASELLTQRMEAFLVGPAAAGMPVPMAELSRSVARSRALFERCRYGELAAAVPELVSAAEATAARGAGRTREVASRLVAETYQIASELCVKLNEDGLALAAADRARAAARASGDPTAIAGSARSVAIALRRLGHRDGATRLLTSTATALDIERRAASSSALGSYSSLMCTAAYALAQQGRRPSALELIGEAEQAADRLGRRDSRLGAATRARTGVYRIGIHTALGDSGAALLHASKVDRRLLPTQERQARFLVDTSRAWEAHGRVDKAHVLLRAAERVAPEELRRPSVSAFVAGLLYGPGPHPAGLGSLATRLGVA